VPRQAVLELLPKPISSSHDGKSSTLGSDITVVMVAKGQLSCWNQRVDENPQLSAMELLKGPAVYHHRGMTKPHFKA